VFVSKITGPATINTSVNVPAWVAGGCV